MNKKQIAAKETKQKILHTSMNLIRQKGLNATTIDDICREAQITKGAFFHHFSSKQDLAIQSADYFSSFADSLFAQAEFHRHPDPLDKILGYIDMREQLLQGETFEYTCLLGTILQEVHQSNADLRDTCKSHVWDHAKMLEPYFEQAIHKYKVQDHNAHQLALYTQAVLQGAFILAKGSQSPQTAKDCVHLLRQHLLLIFTQQLLESK